MEIFAYFFIVTNLVSAAVKAQLPKLKQEAVQNSIEQCDRLANDPFFEVDLVIGKPWRVYHMWNVHLENTKDATKCLDVVFKNATPPIIHRIWSDMSDYMEQQPYWDSAALLLTTGEIQQELLLFPAQGVAGGFTGVPNVIRSGGMTPARNAVPLLKFQMKLIRNGKFLVIMDCHVGITSLTARAFPPPYRAEIGAAAAELNLGDGYSFCTQDKNKDEQLFAK